MALNVHNIERAITDSHKNNVLKWLSIENFIARHSTTGESHAKDTGLWLLEELQQWFDGNGPRLIICEGPGNMFVLSID